MRIACEYLDERGSKPEWIPTTILGFVYNSQVNNTNAVVVRPDGILSVKSVYDIRIPDIQKGES